MPEGQSLEKREETLQPEMTPESILENGEILDSKELKGHWGIELIKIKDAGEALFRPDKETDFLFQETGKKDVHRSDLEVMAFRVAEALEFGLVPPVVFRTINGISGSLQQRISDSHIAEVTDWQEMVNSDELVKAAVFDYLLDVKDRRESNFLVNPQGGKIWLIDHDYFMFWNPVEFHTDILKEVQSSGPTAVTGEVHLGLERFLNKVDRLTALAKPDMIEILKKARDRAEAILEKGEIPR